MTYNEYWQVIDAGFKPEQLVVFKYEDQGVATLEDGLYVLQDKLKDPAFVQPHGEVRLGLHEGLGLCAPEPGRGGRRSCSTTTPPARRPRSTRSA